MTEDIPDSPPETEAGTEAETAASNSRKGHGGGFDPNLLSMLGSLGQMSNLFNRPAATANQEPGGETEADDAYSACANCTERCERYIEMMPLADVRALATTFPVLRA